MASKVSGSRKLKKSNLPKFEADIYSKIPSDGLIVFAVHYLIEQKIEITLEDIVSVCFLLFPHKFGLKRYPKWPDSAPISRHWGDVRRKRYVTANDYLGYRLTTKGIRLVKKAAKVLGVTLPKPMAKVQPVREEKATTPASSIKKVSPVVPVPVKPVQKPEIKAQPVREEKVIVPASSIKKVRPVRAKKAVPVEVKPVQKPETKAQLVREEKATPPASSIKKAHPVRVNKIAPVTVKPVQKPEIKVQPVREEKATPPASPIKKASSVRVKKIAPAPVKPVQKPEIKVQPVREEKATTPASSIKKVRPARAKKAAPAPTQVKQIQKPEIKVLPVKQAEKKQPVHEEKATQLELIKAHPIRAKKAPPTLEKKAQVLPISKPIQSAKAPIKVEGTKPTRSVIVQPVKVEKVQAEPISREAKERAGKFTRMMERSDAYIHYKKHGGNSKINEFDFRSLLLCTMESSAETLARNVELFKGYAGIHNRQDLIAFLVFCEDKFSYLLKPQNKLLRKEKK